jgi:Flp pilus assembly pilin Flp
MRSVCLKLLSHLRDIITLHQGQDLVEYALLVAMLGCAATASVSSVATAINHVLSTVGSEITGSVTT